jgi:hypothetical protein
LCSIAHLCIMDSAKGRIAQFAIEYGKSRKQESDRAFGVFISFCARMEG